MEMSPDLSTYSPLRADWNPSFPKLMYLPMDVMITG